MTYVHSHLLPDETIAYSASRHWSVILFPLLMAGAFMYGGIFFLFLSIKLQNEEHSFPLGMGCVLLLLGAFSVAVAYIRIRSVEMAVTTRRIIVKQGILNTTSIEIPHGKLESIRVDQNILGKILGYGSITIRGVGGTPEPFSHISRPFELRRQVHAFIK